MSRVESNQGEPQGKHLLSAVFLCVPPIGFWTIIGFQMTAFADECPNLLELLIKRVAHIIYCCCPLILKVQNVTSLFSTLWLSVSVCVPHIVLTTDSD